LLSQLCCNDMRVEPGTIVYTGMLNDRGGYEADITVTRNSHDAFTIVTATANPTRDVDWIRRHIGDLFATVTDVSSGFAVLGLFGPKSKELMEVVSDADLSNEAFPFSTSQTIGVGYHTVEAKRITYVGELGWELHVPVESARGVYDALYEASRDMGLGLRDAGYYAIDGLRIEKGYRAWGHELSPDTTPLEAGLGFTLAWDKPGGFIGRDALLKQKEAGITKRCFSWVLSDPSAMPWGDEPLLMDGQMVGTATSTAYGHSLGAPVCLGYISHPDVAKKGFAKAHDFELLIGDRLVQANGRVTAPFDPKHRRVHGEYQAS